MKHSRYHILGEVGQGQFGKVFCGCDRATGQLFALKSLDYLRFPTHSLLRELAILVRLNHPNIVSFHGLEYKSTGRYIVMDYCQGGTLRQLLISKAKLSLLQKLKLVQAILLGLEHVHQHRIIHCDLKPENILLDVTAQGWNAKIADFGVAHFVTSLEPQSDSTGDTGSPAYMAPERFYGRYSPESDLYSIGVLLYELVSGQRPFSGMPIDVMKAHLNQPLRIPKPVPTLLKAIIRKALQKLPQHRYGSATEMRLGLDAVIASLGHPHPLSAVNLTAPLPMEAPLAQRTSVLALQEKVAVSAAVSPKRLPVVGDYRPTARSHRDLRNLSVDPKHLQTCLEWSHPIQGLWLRPQGCFIMAQSAQSLALYLQSQAASQPLDILNVSCESGAASVSQSLDIDPQGHWLAMIGSSERGALQTHQPLTQRELSIFKLAQGRATRPILLKPTAESLWLISPRHLLIAHQPTVHSPSNDGGTRLEFCNRRGQSYWIYEFEGIITAATLSPTHPNQLFATAQDETPTALIIDLAPFKLTRVPLSVRADWVCTAHWGYILGDRTGQLTCLNRRGRAMVQVTVPQDRGEVVTAIAFAKATNVLWIATQNDHSRIQTLDLCPYLPQSLLRL